MPPRSRPAASDSEPSPALDSESSAASPFSDYLLPGVRDSPKVALDLMIATSFAYSFSWNVRKLESPTYGIWAIVLPSLVADIEGKTLTVPQLSHYFLSEDKREKEKGYSSTQTQANSGTTSRSPDFTVMGVSIRDHLKTDYANQLDHWDQIVIQDSKPVVITELKRFASRRCVDREEFALELSASLTIAKDQALTQAAIDFHPLANTPAEELILIVGAGEWWSFRCVKKDEKDMKELINVLDELPEDDKSDDEWEAHSKKKGNKKDKTGGSKKKGAKNQDQQGPSKPKPPADRTPKPKPTRHRILSERWQAPLAKKIEDCAPRAGTWSKFLCIGTKPSNQCFYHLHGQIEALLSTLEPNDDHDAPNETEDLDNDPLDVI